MKISVSVIEELATCWEESAKPPVTESGQESRADAKARGRREQLTACACQLRQVIALMARESSEK